MSPARNRCNTEAQPTSERLETRGVSQVDSDREDKIRLRAHTRSIWSAAKTLAANWTIGSELNGNWTPPDEAQDHRVDGVPHSFKWYEQQAHEEWAALHQFPVQRIDGSGANLDQDLIVPGNGFLDFSTFEKVG